MLDDARYLTENEKAALAEIKQRILKTAPGSAFVLFGSKARGDFEADSDVDVLVLTENELSWRDIEKDCIPV